MRQSTNVCGEGYVIKGASKVLLNLTLPFRRDSYLGSLSFFLMMVMVFSFVVFINFLITNIVGIALWSMVVFSMWVFITFLNRGIALRNMMVLSMFVLLNFV